MMVWCFGSLMVKVSTWHLGMTELPRFQSCLGRRDGIVGEIRVNLTRLVGFHLSSGNSTLQPGWLSGTSPSSLVLYLQQIPPPTTKKQSDGDFINLRATGGVNLISVAGYSFCLRTLHTALVSNIPRAVTSTYPLVQLADLRWFPPDWPWRDSNS